MGKGKTYESLVLMYYHPSFKKKEEKTNEVGKQSQKR